MKNALATRTFYCKKCEKLGFPKKQTIYVVFGKTHDSYDLRFHAGNVETRNIGMTPHIIFPEMISFPTSGGGNIFAIMILCGVVGCGFRIKRSNKDGLWWIYAAADPSYALIKERDLMHLAEYKDHGLYLDQTPQEKWKIDEIAREQMHLYEKLRRAL
jgi:hypothetical protein